MLLSFFFPVSRITLLADLDAFFHSSRRPLPLLVRILHRSRIRFYGKPGQNIDFPFQVSWDHRLHWFFLSAAIDYFSVAKHNLFLRSLFLSLFQVYCELADQSGIMSMVVWNDLCPEWFNRLTVGSVLYLQQYSLKHSYQKRSRPQIHTLSLMTFHSIGMNSRAFPKLAFLCKHFSWVCIIQDHGKVTLFQLLGCGCFVCCRDLLKSSKSCICSDGNSTKKCSASVGSAWCPIQLCHKVHILATYKHFHLLISVLI